MFRGGVPPKELVIPMYWVAAWIVMVNQRELEFAVCNGVEICVQPEYAEGIYILKDTHPRYRLEIIAVGIHLHPMQVHITFWFIKTERWICIIYNFWNPPSCLDLKT